MFEGIWIFLSNKLCNTMAKIPTAPLSTIYLREFEKECVLGKILKRIKMNPENINKLLTIPISEAS